MFAICSSKDVNNITDTDREMTTKRTSEGDTSFATILVQSSHLWLSLLLLVQCKTSRSLVIHNVLRSFHAPALITNLLTEHVRMNVYIDDIGTTDHTHLCRGEGASPLALTGANFIDPTSHTCTSLKLYSVVSRYKIDVIDKVLCIMTTRSLAARYTLETYV